MRGWHGGDAGLRRKARSGRRRAGGLHQRNCWQREYSDTKQWAQNAPKDTETLGLTYNKGSWNLGFFNKRVGRLYNDNGAIHEAFVIEPFNLTNLFVNYTLAGSSRLSASRIRLAINNLTDSRAITGVPKGGTAKSTSLAPSPLDLLTVMPGRSVSVSLTVGVIGR